MTMCITKKIYRSLLFGKKQTTSVLASDNIREKLDKLFVVPNDTRWNSTFDALTKVNVLQNEKNLELTSLFITFELHPINENK